MGKVVAAENLQVAAGALFDGPFGWQEYAIANGKGVRKLDPAIAPVSTALGILGMPGPTAYFGLLDIGKPRAGGTVVVSGVVGALGLIAGRLPKIIPLERRGNGRQRSESCVTPR